MFALQCFEWIFSANCEANWSSTISAEKTLRSVASHPRQPARGRAGEPLFPAQVPGAEQRGLFSVFVCFLWSCSVMGRMGLTFEGPLYAHSRYVFLVQKCKEWVTQRGQVTCPRYWAEGCDQGAPPGCPIPALPATLARTRGWPLNHWENVMSSPISAIWLN